MEPMTLPSLGRPAAWPWSWCCGGRCPAGGKDGGCSRRGWVSGVALEECSTKGIKRSPIFTGF